MSTSLQARDQLSQDIGDFWSETTTAAGDTAGYTLVDSRLTEEEPEEFLSGRTWVELEVAGDVRRVRSLAAPTGELTLYRAAAAQIATAKAYRIHRLFHPTDKDRAITQAVSLCRTFIMPRAEVDITTVAEQLDYDQSAAAFINDWPRQALLIDNEETERWSTIQNWTISETNRYFHLNSEITAGRTIRLIGHTDLTLTTLTTKTLPIVTARAGMWLYEQAITSRGESPFLAGALRRMTARFNERKTQNTPPQIPWATTSSGIMRNQSHRDINFGAA